MVKTDKVINDLRNELKEAQTDLIIARNNAWDAARSGDYRWEGVSEKLQKRINSINEVLYKTFNRKTTNTGNKLTEQGYDNLITLLEDYAGVLVNRQFIDDHYEQLSQNFESEEEGRKSRSLSRIFSEEELEDPHWTFENEVNSDTVLDTSPRELVIDGFAKLMTNMEWPLNCDSHEYKEEFKRAFFFSVKNTENIELVSAHWE